METNQLIVCAKVGGAMISRVKIIEMIFGSALIEAGISKSIFPSYIVDGAKGKKLALEFSFSYIQSRQRRVATKGKVNILA
jgi:hypothetical protein